MYKAKLAVAGAVIPFMDLLFFSEKIRLDNHVMYWGNFLYNLALSNLWANSADDKLMSFLFFLENGITHITQIVSLGDNLHKMSNHFFLRKEETFFSKCHLLNLLSVNYSL